MLSSRTTPLPIALKSTTRPPGAQTQEQGRLRDASLENSSDISVDPCEACRKALSKCVLADEDESPCVPCKVSGSNCSLIRSPQPRKRKLGDECSNESNGRRSPPGASSDGRRLQHHHSGLPSTVGSTSFLQDMANVGGPTLLSRTLGLQHNRYSQYIGPTTDFEPSLINLSPFDPHDESLLGRGTLRKVSDHDTFLLLPDSNTPGHNDIFDDVEEVQRAVEPYGRRLIDLYFEVIHPAFPIIQKGVFYEKYERSFREFSPPVLAAVYILAINWWDHCDDLAGKPRPNVRELERLVRTTLADAMYRPKLSTIQAGLLLSQRPEGDQWAPTAQLIAIGQELGLHLDCTDWKIPLWEKGLRKRLGWTLFMQDKWGSMVHGRPSHIFSANWAVKPLVANDFPDIEWGEGDTQAKEVIEKGRLTFQLMVQLSEILSEILETFYSINAMQSIADAGTRGTHLVLRLAKPIQLKLKEWHSGLPPSIKIESYPKPSVRLSSVGHLHLAYFAAEITLHRRIIRSIEATSNSSPSSPMINTAIDPGLQVICRQAAKARLISAMDFVNRLSSAHLRAFWYFASKTNFALIGTFGSLLWATSLTREEADWYRRRLGEYRWTLAVSSKPGAGAGEGKGLTQFAMTMLDISTGLLKKLPEKPELSAASSMAEMAGLSYSFPLMPDISGGSPVGAGSGGLYMGMKLGSGSNLGQLKGVNGMDLSNGGVTPESMSEDESGDDDMYD